MSVCLFAFTYLVSDDGDDADLRIEAAQIVVVIGADDLVSGYQLFVTVLNSEGQSARSKDEPLSHLDQPPRL